MFNLNRSSNSSYRPALEATLLIAICGVFAISGCSSDQPTEPSSSSPEAKKQTETQVTPKTNDSPPSAERTESPPAIRFTEVAESIGLGFTHRSGASGEFTYPEILSGGVCLADFNGDNWLDAYLTQGGPTPGTGSGKQAGRNSMFLNDGKGNFRDASADSGADDPGYGMGAFPADVDRDGDLDLLVTNVNSIVLLRNDGNAKFTDVSTQSGIPLRDGMWLNAAFADFNGDGILDLYVANYTIWDPQNDVSCKAPGGGADYCNPTSFAGATDLLMIGNGDGTFREVTESAGIAKATTRSMGVVAFDIEHDGDQDIFVANDGEENVLWVNQGNGTFVEEALLRGVALNGAGAAEASMGVACADIDDDGDEDLLITHLAQETHTLYRNDKGYFTDVTATAGIGGWSRPDTGFGVGLADFNLDGFLDVFAANGAVARPVTPRNAKSPYAQSDQIAIGSQRGVFRESRKLESDDEGTEELLPALVSRGSAIGDIDNDGLIDIVVVAKDAPLRVWHNESRVEGTWIGIVPVSSISGTSNIGAEVIYFDSIGAQKLATVRPHGSYLSSNESVVRFATGDQKSVAVEIRWPDGLRESFSSLATGKVHRVVLGQGSTKSIANIARPANSGESPKVTSTPKNANAGSGKKNPGDAPRPSPKNLGPIPPLRITITDGQQDVQLDTNQLNAWCKQAGLPPAPTLIALDPPTWRLVHAAIEAAGRAPTEKNLSELAMLYDGHRALASATELYARVVELNPRDVRWHQLYGRAALEQGEFETAIYQLNQAFKLDPSRPEILGRLGEAHQAAGQPAKALEYWQSYVKRQPSQPIGLQGIALAAESLSQRKLALKSAQSALRLNGKAKSTLVIAARIAAQLGESDLAKQYSERASKLNKDNNPVLPDKTDTYMREFARSVEYLRKAAFFFKDRQQWQRALGYAKLLAERRPQESQSWKLLTLISLSSGDVQNAGSYAEKTLRLDPDFAPAWEAVARSRMAGKDLPGALRAIDKAIAVDPLYSHANVTRGVILGIMKKWKPALVSLKKGIAKHPNDIEGLISIAAAYAGTGNLVEARGAIRKAVTLSPGHPLAQQVYRQLHQPRPK